MRVLSALAALLALASEPVAAADWIPQFAAYHETWSEAATADASATRLARLPGYIDLVMLAFAKPDSWYVGDLDLRRTGLGFPFSGAVVRDAVAELRRRHPSVRVLLSVGGSTYKNWDALDPEAIARLVDDLGLDGADVDFEPATPGCHAAAGRVSCASDAALASAVGALRRALPRPRLLAMAGWSVGAFGEGEWANTRPTSRYTGMSLALLRSRGARLLDAVTVMAYDAGPRLDPIQAFAAYRALFSGPLLLGAEVQDGTALPPAGREEQAMNLSSRVRALGGGMMLYSLQMASSADGPGGTVAAAIAAGICRGLGRAGCADPLP